MKNKITAISIGIFLLFSLINPVFCQHQENKSNNAADSIYINETQHLCVKSFIIPATLILAGSFMSLNNHIIDRFEVMEERNEDYGLFHHKADNYLQFTPLVFAGIAELTERNTKTIIKKHAVNLIKTELIMIGLTRSMKAITQVKRPDSETRNSFPSGHSAQAFALAAFFCNEYGHTSTKWLSVGAFAIATTTGVMRILNGRHWISDVVAGAGVGMLSANLGCMDWRINKKGKTTSMIIPAFSKEYTGAILTIGF